MTESKQRKQSKQVVIIQLHDSTMIYLWTEHSRSGKATTLPKPSANT